MRTISDASHADDTFVVANYKCGHVDNPVAIQWQASLLGDKNTDAADAFAVEPVRKIFEAFHGNDTVAVANYKIGLDV